MDMGLKGTVAIVTASSRGLGKAIARGLALEGSNVVMSARTTDQLEKAAAEVSKETGVTVIAVPTDVTNGESVRSMVDRAVERFGRLDILVNNAGGPPSGSFEKFGDDAWYDAFELNLLSAVRLVRASLPHLKASGRGRIINMTGTAVKEPVQNLGLSNSIRAGVVGLAKTLANELGPSGITVNNIAPGRIGTDRIKYLDQARAKDLGITEEEVSKSFLAQIPLGRYGDPEDVANLAVFLASARAGYITGTTIQVDGGMVKSIF